MTYFHPSVPVIFLAISLVSRSCSGIQFDVNAYSKCIGEEIQSGVLVVGDYSVVDAPSETHRRVAAKVPPFMK